MTDVRSLSRFIWINVDCEAGEKMITPKNSPKRINDVEVNALRQQRLSGKRRAIRMLACFLYATKHHLREEKGIEWEDYQGLIPEDVRSSFYRLSKQSREFYRRSMHSVLSSSAPATGTSEAFTGSATGAPPVASREQPDERTPLTAEEAEEDAAHANLPAVPFPLFCLHFVASYLTSARRAGLLTNDAGPAGFSMVSAHKDTVVSVTLTVPRFSGQHIDQQPDRTTLQHGANHPNAHPSHLRGAPKANRPALPPSPPTDARQRAFLAHGPRRDHRRVHADWAGRYLERGGDAFRT
jgi:ion channel-forming bestrophin family protein